MANVMDIMEMAYVCVDTCMGVQEGQKVLIIVDRGSPRLWRGPLRCSGS